MTEVLQPNIFFFIASIATIVFCIFVCFILYHVLKIVRSIRTIVERIEEGSGVIAEDVAFMRSWMRGGIARIFGVFGGGAASAKRRKKGDVTNDDE